MRSRYKRIKSCAGFLVVLVLITEMKGPFIAWPTHCDIEVRTSDVYEKVARYNNSLENMKSKYRKGADELTMYKEMRSIGLGNFIMDHL